MTDSRSELPPRGKKILIVDDDPDVIEYLSSFLEDHDYAVRSAQSTNAALAELGRSRPDAILIDILMPGRSGLDLLLNVRRNPEWAEIPVVVITGHDKILEDDCQSYLGSRENIRGPDGVLGKPVDRNTLLSVLRVVAGEKAGE
ncbi:MAG: response regulator [Planctomycetes bacterium]|nr:response regulator [Planctomycetota bacterium]